MAAAKARGITLGNPNFAGFRDAGRAARTSIADKQAAAVLPVIAAVQAGETTFARQIAAALNARGVTTAGNARWDGKAVASVLARA